MPMREAPWLAMFALVMACSDDKSATELNPEGPPMVRQLLVQEKVATETSVRERIGLAFGDHPLIPTLEEDPVSGDDRQVTAAVAFGGGAQRMRVVLDELVRGNYLEEIACADGSWSRVPVGADPDDITNCAPPELSKCEKVCIGDGGPIGILDVNEDGAVDDTRMIDYGDGELGISVVCGGERMPLDQELSFYNPSGNQLIPAGPIGLDGLGPAIVVVPTLGLRTGSECTLAFRPEVVDKDDNRVCAPENGDIDNDCAPGNTDAIQFTVEPLALKPSGSNPADGESGIALKGSDGSDPYVTLQFIANISADSLGAITLETAAGDPVTVAPEIRDDASLVLVVVPGGYLPNTEYTVTVGTALTDVFGGPLPEPFTISFTTGDAEELPPDAGPVPDAGAPDAAL